jgi:hypothetical protein
LTALLPPSSASIQNGSAQARGIKDTLQTRPTASPALDHFIVMPCIRSGLWHVTVLRSRLERPDACPILSFQKGRGSPSLLLQVSHTVHSPQVSVLVSHSSTCLRDARKTCSYSYSAYETTATGAPCYLSFLSEATPPIQPKHLEVSRTYAWRARQGFSSADDRRCHAQLRVYANTELESEGLPPPSPGSEWSSHLSFHVLTCPGGD